MVSFLVIFCVVKVRWEEIGVGGLEQDPGDEDAGKEENPALCWASRQPPSNT